MKGRKLYPPYTCRRRRRSEKHQRVSIGEKEKRNFFCADLFISLFFSDRVALQPVRLHQNLSSDGYFLINFLFTDNSRTDWWSDAIQLNPIVDRFDFLWHLIPIIWGFPRRVLIHSGWQFAEAFAESNCSISRGIRRLTRFIGYFLEILARRTQTLATVHDNFTTRSEATAREAQISSNFFLRWCSCLRS